VRAPEGGQPGGEDQPAPLVCGDAGEKFSRVDRRSGRAQQLVFAKSADDDIARGLADVGVTGV